MKLAIQAIIMAGGEGVRLRPLTVERPKPLAPLLGEPVMGYAIRLLKRHGVSDIGASLWYQPRKIRDAFGKGENYGVHLKYYEESAPMGTAGSLRMAMDHLKGTFFVLSGDGLTDCDLTEALRFHQEKKALATLVLKRVSVPLPYGVVLTDKENRITQFIEKPAWSRVFSDLVNTGIYILEPEIFDWIPDQGMPDFGKDIFPALLKQGLPLYGYETEGYWCDVGNQRAYLEAQQALLRGEAALPHESGVHPSARIDPSARIEGHCLVGRDAVIGPGALISNAVIGEGCVIGAGAAVENACLWERAAVQEQARLRGCVVCDRAAVRRGAVAGDGCALGQGAALGAYSELRPGVKIWPHIKTASGTVITQNLVSGDYSAHQWTERGADCDRPENVCALMAAYARVTGARQVIALGDGSNALLSIAAGALGASGVRVISAGEGTAAMLRALIRALRADGGVFAAGQTVQFMDENGAALSSKRLSAMDACVQRQDVPPAFVHPGQVVRLTGTEEIYLAHALPPGEGKALWSPVAVFSNSAALRRLALAGLNRMDARNARSAQIGQAELREGETGFLLSENGEEWSAFTRDCAPSREQMNLLLLSLCQRRQGEIYDLPGVPRAAARLAPLREADQSPACLWQREIMQDGLAALFLIAEALKGGTLPDLLRDLPETHIMIRDVSCRLRDKGRILHTLCDRTKLPHTLGEGVRIQHERGFATITPDAHRSMVRVVSESGDSEFAQELCDFYLGQIQRITGDSASS